MQLPAACQSRLYDPILPSIGRIRNANRLIRAIVARAPLLKLSGVFARACFRGRRRRRSRPDPACASSKKVWWPYRPRNRRCRTPARFTHVGRTTRSLNRGRRRSYGVKLVADSEKATVAGRADGEIYAQPCVDPAPTPRKPNLPGATIRSKLAVASGANGGARGYFELCPFASAR